jgi:hypothetical protein
MRAVIATQPAILKEALKTDARRTQQCSLTHSSESSSRATTFVCCETLLFTDNRHPQSMSDRAMPEMYRFPSSLHRGEEEDLIDYGDSDVEADTTETTAIVTIEEIDIFADDATHLEVPEQSGQPGDTKDTVEQSTKEPTVGLKEESAEETAAQPATLPASTDPPTTTKTAEAASVIKNLNELLTNAEFRTALGLVEPGSSLDLSFWADGLDFALSLKLVGTAEVKACRFGAECRNKECTFSHGGADRTTILASKKPRKLCSKINMPGGCLKGDGCWFSHEAFGVACIDGHLRATCVKGPYCVYKHNDDEVVASVEHLEQTQGQTVNGEAIKEADTTAPGGSVDSTNPAKTDDLPALPTPSTDASPKQQARGVKRGHDPDDEACGKPEKAQRVEQRQNHREQSGRWDRRGSSVPQRADSEHPGQSRRGSGSRARVRRGDRGGKRGGGGGKSDSYRPSEERQRGGRNQLKKESLEKRMTRS